MDLSIDLQGLGELARPEAGELAEMSVDRIHPDPRNKILREQDEQTPEAIEEQRELDADVGAVGIKSPLSLRPHPDIPGDWIINHGHRRFKAALSNGMETVPYFVDKKFTSYDQVKENSLRRGLAPWAFAEFIKSRLDENESKGEIAAGLGKSHNFVTEHLALVDAPECLHFAYAQGVKSPRTLYDLRRAYDEFPVEVTDWCHTGVQITRNTIQALLSDLRHDAAADEAAKAATQAQASGMEPPALRHDVEPEPEPAAPGHAAKLRHDVKPELERPETAAPVPAGQASPSRDPAPKAGADELRHDEKTQAKVAPLASPKTPATPVGIMVEYKGRTAIVDPASTVTVRFSDGETAQVVLAKVTVLPTTA
jgi:ParB family chromosome partitioning protein